MGSSGTGAGSPKLREGIGIARWWPSYDGEIFQRDIVAGLTVAVFLIPQSMAYAHLAGVPAIYGLYASVVPLVVYALLGSSLQLAVGVVAIDMLILHAGLEQLAEPFSPRYVELALVLALMVGTIQLLMGLIRMGFMANLLSRPVMVGFTSGAAILIALSQAGPMTGMDMESARLLPASLWLLLTHLGDVRLAPLFLGVASVLAMLGLRRIRPLFPAALTVIVVGTVVAELWLPSVDRVGQVPTGLPLPGLPEVDYVSLRALVPTALTLALIQFVTALSLGKFFAARRGYSIDPNAELVALGGANLAGSLFHSLPVSGSFGRSALNDQAGAMTPLANAAAALVVAVALLLITPLLALIPVPVLGAIIVVTALGLLDVPSMRFLFQAKTVDGWVAAVTFVATLGAGIVEGIVAGIVVSLLFLLSRVSRPHTTVLGHLPGTRSFRDVRKSADSVPVAGVLILRIDASFSFMNAEYLKSVVLKETSRAESGTHAVVLDASSVNDLDTTAAAVLLEVAGLLDERDVDLYFGGVKEPVMKTLEATGLRKRLGKHRFFLSPHGAVLRALREEGSAAPYLRNVPGVVADAEEEAAERL